MIGFCAQNAQNTLHRLVSLHNDNVMWKSCMWCSLWWRYRVTKHL